jgi:hypothetical protein
MGVVYIYIYKDLTSILTSIRLIILEMKNIM